MNTDAELLRQFVDDGSEAAFTELVRRHMGLVRTTALRRVGGDVHAADDVTQQVFVALARKAASLRNHATLAGWLYIGTHHATANWVRREQRRKQREVAASSMSTPDSSPGVSVDAAQLRPLLDDALITLKPDEREAIVLRFFSGHTFAEIGAALTVSEDAARKRVDRALEKLHAVLFRRGVTSSVAALGSALAVAGMEPVPVGLVVQVAGVALSKAATPGLVASVASVLWPVAAAVALVGGTAGIFNQHRANAEVAAAIATAEPGLREAIVAAETENRQFGRDLTALRSAEVKRTQAAARHADGGKPAVVGSGPVKSEGVAVAVSPEGVVLWGGKAVRLEEFIILLLDHQATAPAGESRLVVSALGARFRQLNWVLDEARKTGIAHLVVESDAAPVGPMNTWF